MTLRPRSLLSALLALLISSALLGAYATACTTESKLPTKGEKEGQCNPALAEMPKCLTGDPIDAATGNLTEEQTDIPALGGRGPALGITRSYNSQLAAAQKEAEVGPFGYGWTGPYSAKLTLNAEAETATVRQDNGATAVFYLKEGKYSPPGWNLSTFVKEGENYVFTLPTQEKLEFDKTGKLVKETDRHKLSLTLTYNGSSQLETVKDAAGRTLTFTYKEGKVESVKDPMGHTVKYSYEAGNLVKVTLPGETEANWKFKYDGSHQLTEITDGRGNTTKNEYDASNRVKAQTEPLERKRSFEYKETGGVKETVISEPNGSKTLEKFNEMGEPTEIVKAQGTELAQTTKYEYNASYLQTKETDPNSHATIFGYDAEGNRTSEKDANENETKWAYNKTHDLTSETTPKGETTTINRNATTGDVESIKRPAPGATTQETKFEYAENGDLKAETDPLGHKTAFEYDTYGDRKAETDAAEDKTTWTYDEDGRPITEVSPRGNEAGAEPSKFETKTERDAQGRQVKVTDPLGHETKYKYDAAGNLEVITNPNAHATTYVYDAANERTEVKAANGDVSKTAYDSMGQVKSKTDGNSKTTKYERNALEQITETIDPLERKTTRKYDATGNLKELKDPEGRTTTYTYDAANRLKEVKYTEEATKPVTYAYGKDGEVTEMKDATGTTKNTYDELDRLTESTNGNKEVVKYEYNLGNQATKITYPNTKAVTQTFDAAGRLEAVKDWLGGETKFAYNRDSMPKTTTFPSASTNKDEYEYNAADQLAKTTMLQGATTLASIGYERDSIGQLKAATQTGLPGAAKPEYGYDTRERMTSGSGGSYEYDAAGNPTKVAGTTYSYDGGEQLKEGGGTKFTFNNMGQRTKSTPASGPATTYGYDQAGNLISVKRPEEGAVSKIEDSYVYDGTSLRASETINGATNHLAWSTAAGLPLLLYDGTLYYLYGPEGLPLEQISSETPTYLHHDQQGSTRLLTNSSGEAKGKYTYTPYGAIEKYEGSVTTPLGYDGQYTSSDTGLIYLRARVYDPSTAQFMSVDPIVSQTKAPYFYAGDAPINGGDPSGLCADVDCNALDEELTSKEYQSQQAKDKAEAQQYFVNLLGAKKFLTPEEQGRLLYMKRIVAKFEKEASRLDAEVFWGEISWQLNCKGKSPPVMQA
jgi:RHS repeat-associated protein